MTSSAPKRNAPTLVQRAEKDQTQVEQAQQHRRRQVIEQTEQRKAANHKATARTEEEIDARAKQSRLEQLDEEARRARRQGDCDYGFERSAASASRCKRDEAQTEEQLTPVRVGKNVEVRPLGGGAGCLTMILLSVVASILLTLVLNFVVR